MPKVSVIIPAYNEEAVIEECLESLSNQSCDNYEVIVVDDCSTDSTSTKIKAFCEKWPLIFRYRMYGKVGPGKARNLAAKETSADFLAFMDADCVATPTWLEELLKVYNHDAVGSVGGPHLAPATSTPFQLKVEDFFSASSVLVDFYKGSREVYEVKHNPLCNTSYRREVFWTAGGFREDIFPGEDVAIDFHVRRNGHKIFYQPKALVYHHRPETIQQFRKVMRAYGRSQGKLVRDYGLKRKIQIVGILVLLIVFTETASLVLSGKTFSAIVLVAFFFFFRPNNESLPSVYVNALEWFNGFIHGLISAKSPPPGGVAK